MKGNLVKGIGLVFAFGALSACHDINDPMHLEQDAPKAAAVAVPTTTAADQQAAFAAMEERREERRERRRERDDDGGTTCWGSGC